MAEASDTRTLTDAAPVVEDDPGSAASERLPLLSHRAVRIGFGVTVTLLIMLPALVAIGKLAGRPWLPVDDFGITDLRVRDVFSWNTPLTGLYSRPGWNHPGPLMFWLMGLVSAPTGGAAWATRISGAVIQGAALGWLGWVTWRRGLRTFLAAATVTALSYLALGPWLFTQPWNPNIPVPVFILFLYLTCLAADGAFRQLIALSVVGNVMLQIHISYTSFVIVGFAWVIGFTLWDAWRTQRAPPRWRSTVIASGVVWIVVWILPVVDVVVNPPGNLWKIFRYFTEGDHGSVGLRAATGIMSGEFEWVPPWLGGSTRLDPIVAYALPSTRTWLLVPVVLLGLGFLAARRAGSRTDARRVAFAALVFLVGIVAISSADEPRAYTFQWRAVVAAFIFVTSVWSIARAFERRAALVVRYGALTVVLVAIAWGSIDLGRSVASLPDYTGLEGRGPVLGEVMGHLRREGLPKDEVVLVEPVGSSLPSLYDGMINELARAGVDVRVPPGRGRIFGEQRTARADEADEIWIVAEEGSYLPELLRQRGARLVAATTPLTPEEESETARLQEQLIRQLEEAQRMDLRDDVDHSLVAFAVAGVRGVDKAAADRLGLLNERVQRSGGCRCVVVAVPGPGK